MPEKDAPNFFIIGAAKCGTTALANALRRHPEIFIPELKETLFFSNDVHYGRGMQDYLRRYFPGAERFPARGEATPHYLAFEKAAQRIRDSLPAESHRFIAIFRDPVERAYSLYWNMVYEGFETLDFEQALEHEPERALDAELEAYGSLRFRYFASGLYAAQLHTYFRYFERDRFLLLFQEDFQRSPRAVLTRICAFLGVGEHFDLGTDERANPAGLPRSVRIQHFLRRPHWIKEPLKRLLSESVRQRIAGRLLRWNKRVVEYPPMQSATESALRARYREDVEELAILTGRDLTHWLPAAHERGS